MTSIENILKQTGPTRSSVIVKKLSEQNNISEVTARQRLSRAKPPVMKFPVPLLPNRENFIYLKEQRSTERFWANFHNALRETNSAYGAAIDALIRRGGKIEVEEFPVISGLPIALKKQISSGMVLRNLIDAGVVERKNQDDKEYVYLIRHELSHTSSSYPDSLRVAENIILDGLREWARKIGLASYNKITIRGDDEKRQVGAFKWDMTGPSYILPLKGQNSKPGFLVADVFAEGILTEHEIRYFIKKTQLLQASVKDIKLFPLLVAEGFDGNAMKYGKGAGIILASTGNLFGVRVARGIETLIQTLNNAAAIAVGNPKKLTKLLDDLSQIEGATGNLRGILFELVCIYLVKDDSSSVDHAVMATDPETGKKADIDVLQVRGKTQCTAIECKGKGPSGVVDLEEVEDWIARLKTFKAHIKNQERFRETQISFELWTTGNFTDDALQKLEKEKSARVKAPIAWKNGDDVLEIAKKAKEKGIAEALKQHFLRHPLND